MDTFDFLPCDFTVDIPEGHRPKLLQITDMQIIDSSQRRVPERLRASEIKAWDPQNISVECFDHIKSLVAQSNPDLIFITGDIVYGEFDDSGRTFTLFCEFMDSLDIPWAPVFGNHDNESARGVAWQCGQFEKSKNCLFKRGEINGNGNYTVGIKQGERLVRVLYMMDSNGCAYTSDPEVCRRAGFADDQVEWLRTSGERIVSETGASGFVCFHISTSDFADAALKKGYQHDAHDKFVIGVDCEARDGDFGCKAEYCYYFETPNGLRDAMSAAHIDGVFVGHSHSINTSILFDGIRWTFGLKTGQYDYHIDGQLGGTLITLNPDAEDGAPLDNTDSATFAVRHIPALTLYGPFPIKGM